MHLGCWARHRGPHRHRLEVAHAAPGGEVRAALRARGSRRGTARTPAGGRFRAAHLWNQRTSFNSAVEAENTLGFSEPGPLPFSARHWLGAALIEAGDYIQAESIYRGELEKHPHNGWSLFGLKQALAGQDINDEKINADFEDSWARSNLFITSSRF